MDRARDAPHERHYDRDLLLALDGARHRLPLFQAGYSSDAFAYLFGSILAVSDLDIGLAAVLVAVAAGATRLWGRWAYASFDRDLAKADGLPVDRDDDMLSCSSR